MNGKKALLIGGGVIGVLAIITATIIIVSSKGGKTLTALTGKIDENKAKNVVETYFEGKGNADSKKMLSVYDYEGNFIFQRYKEKDFDENYANRAELVKKFLDYMGDNSVDEALERMAINIESVKDETYKITEYTSIEDSKESKNIIVVNAKIQILTKIYNRSGDIKIYLLKNNGDYKVVHYELKYVYGK